MKDVLYQWEFAEYHQHERGGLWYVTAGVITAGLFVWATMTANYLFGIIVMLAVFIIFLRDTRSPERMRFTITPRGIEYGLVGVLESIRVLRWKELKHFWLIYEPPEVKSLYFHQKTFWAPTLVIPLKKQDPVKVRNALKKYLDEDTTQEYEPVADTLRRALRL